MKSPVLNSPPPQLGQRETKSLTTASTLHSRLTPLSVVMYIFGDWSKNTADLRENFTQARPFPHVVIPDFFSEAVLKTIVPSFPSPLDKSLTWHHYDNPIEQKYSLDDFSHLPQFQEMFESLQGDEAVKLFQEVTGIDNLEADPLLHGAGLQWAGAAHRRLQGPRSEPR